MKKSLVDFISSTVPYIAYENFNYSINISLKNNYLYVETPKVACSTIKATLQKLELGINDTELDDGVNWHDRSASPLLMPSQIDDFKSFLCDESLFKFCFVRNPYERLLSSYLNKIAGNKPPKRKILLQLGLNPERLDTPVSFGQFVEAIAEQSISEMDRHWRPQYFQTFQTGIGFDFIGKIENFDQDFNYVLKKIFRDKTCQVTSDFRHSTNANSHLSDFYSPLLTEMVYKKYEIDFKYFGYEN